MSHSKINYPRIRRDETVNDICHGQTISDPYRWLEDPHSEETQNFIREQNEITHPYLKSCSARDDIISRLGELWNYPKYSCPFRRGNRYFYFMNLGLQNQSVLYVQDTLDDERQVFLDPNELSEEGSVAVYPVTCKFSDDGELFAYGLTYMGSDWITIHFKNVTTGEVLPDVLKFVKFSNISWTTDNKGIFYARYPDGGDGSETTNLGHQKLYYHRVGTDQSEDILVIEFPEHPLWRIASDVSDCGKYLIITTQEGCRDHQMFFADLEEPIMNDMKSGFKFTQVVHEFEANYSYVSNEGSMLYFRTNKGAPNHRVIGIDFHNHAYENWITLLPEHPTNVLDWVACVDEDKLVTCYMEDVKNILELRNLKDGSLIKSFPLEVGTIIGYSGRKDQNEMFFQFASFLTPDRIFHVDFTDPKFEAKIFREVSLPGFDCNIFTTKQVFYSSRDGTKIPMFIIHKKDINTDQSPCLLYGYGGFNISLQPAFSVTRLIFMQHFNGIVAVPNLRGGGEYGENWHNGGRLLNKQNVFDDFQCAAEYLIEEKYTIPSKICAMGGSNGGFLVGACINQRPDLFGAAVAQVGVMDLLRFHKFTIGHAWTTDYGCPDEQDHFENLLKLSPLHNVRVPSDETVQYPAVLLLTADHDDRVVPLHSFKFIAQLQHVINASEKQTNPLLIRIDTKSGHGLGKPTSKMIEEHGDILTFMMQTLGADFKV